MCLSVCTTIQMWDTMFLSLVSRTDLELRRLPLQVASVIPCFPLLQHTVVAGGGRLAHSRCLSVSHFGVCFWLIQFCLDDGLVFGGVCLVPTVRFHRYHVKQKEHTSFRHVTGRSPLFCAGPSLQDQTVLLR